MNWGQDGHWLPVVDAITTTKLKALPENIGGVDEVAKVQTPSNNDHQS